MLFLFFSKFYFCVFSFINPRRHIHSRTVRRRLYDVGISAEDRFTDQHDYAHGQIAKFANFFSQQNNITCMYHLTRRHLNTYGISFVIALIYEYGTTQTQNPFKKAQNISTGLDKHST